MILLGLGSIWSIGATLVTVFSYLLGVIGIASNFSDIVDVLSGFFSSFFK